MEPAGQAASKPSKYGGYFFKFLVSVVFFFFAFGFLASWLFGFSASWLFGFLLVYAAFGGFLVLAFRILCIPSSSSAGGILAFAAFRWFMWLFCTPQHPSVYKDLCLDLEWH